MVLHLVLLESYALQRITCLLDDVARDPFAGIGKPEQLRHALAGAWLRRIDAEHRLVYLVDGNGVILQARYHAELLSQTCSDF